MKPRRSISGGREYMDDCRDGRYGRIWTVFRRPRTGFRRKQRACGAGAVVLRACTTCVVGESYERSARVIQASVITRAFLAGVSDRVEPRADQNWPSRRGCTSAHNSSQPGPELWTGESGDG